MAAEPTMHELEIMFVGDLERILTPRGWIRREAGRFALASFTKDIGGGVLAVADIVRTRISMSARGEDVFEVRRGVGFEPALNLMPVLSLEPDPMLVNEPDGTDRAAFTLSGKHGTVAATRERVATAVEGAAAFAGTFVDAAAIYAAMLAVDRRHVEDGLAHRSSHNSDEGDATTRGEPAGTPAEDIDADSLVTYAVDIRKRLIMLASMRNLDELQTMLDANADAPERGRLASNWERFDRQLHRWLDAGAPVVPPLAETMALLPRRRQLDRVSWSASRARSRAQQDAKKAAAAAADSDDPAKIAALLQAENERRGLVNSPFVLAMGVEVIRKERRSLGRFRSAAAVVKVVASMGSGFAREVKHHPDPPDWMQPPQRASYEVPCAQSATAVRLDVGARDIVERAAAGDRRAVLFTSVPIWLTRDPDDASWALAFLGHTRVGRLPLSDGFDQALRAAEFYDEDPVLDGVIWRLGETEPVALQVSNPDYE